MRSGGGGGASLILGKLFTWTKVRPEIGHQPVLKHTFYEKNFNLAKSGLDSGGGALVGRSPYALWWGRRRVLHFRLAI